MVQHQTECASSSTTNVERSTKFYGPNKASYEPELVITYTVAQATPDYPKINIGDAFKTVELVMINVGGEWKEVSAVQINVGDAWKNLTA